MATKPHQPGPNHSQRNGDGVAKWLLGALGLMGAGQFALRVFRISRPPPRRWPSGEWFETVRPVVPMRGHETRDANAKWIFAVVAFLFLSGLAIHGILVWFLSALNHSPAPKDAWTRLERPAHSQSPRPPFPVLQVSPPLDLQEFRAREDDILTNYGWIDRTGGVARVPIARAMELVLKEGLPVRTNANQAQPGPSSYELMQQRVKERQP